MENLLFLGDPILKHIRVIYVFPFVKKKIKTEKRSRPIHMYVYMYIVVTFFPQIAAKKHILQYAIKFKDFQFVKMLCDAGADVNMQIRVNNYIWVSLTISKLIMTLFNTVKILKFGTPQTIAIIVLKIEKFDVTLH